MDVVSNFLQVGINKMATRGRFLWSEFNSIALAWKPIVIADIMALDPSSPSPTLTVKWSRH